MAARKRATVVTMLLAAPDEGRTVYGVFQATVNFSDRGRSWDWNLYRARHVASVTVRTGEPNPSYLDMARQYATPQYPALDLWSNRV